MFYDDTSEEEGYANYHRYDDELEDAYNEEKKRARSMRVKRSSFVTKSFH